MEANVKNKATKLAISRSSGFEALYVAVREHEKKVYTDEQLQALPDFDIHRHEWQVRRRSSGRLTRYLEKKNRQLNILEIGCGNGWLSAKMAGIPKTFVIGLDINKVEIDQANRVFKKDNLEFVYVTFNEANFDQKKFDIVVFAASLQYFPSVVTVLRKVFDILKQNGEIHIIDTPFYSQEEAGKAAERCRQYYADMGMPEMAEHYFHHSFSEFSGFNYNILFDPARFLNRLFKKHPFYWIAINK